MTIAIIGLGNMGRPIAEALRADFDIVACEREDDVNEKLKDCDAFIIAVKPQSFDELAASVSADLSGKLAISIMAGVMIEKIQKSLHMKRVARAMPNLGVKLGAGMTGWAASGACADDDRQLVKKICGTMGKEIEIEESSMDALSAISGSGPAYFFYLTELLQEKAREFGFDERQARELAEQTFVGAAKLLEAEEKTAGEWREAVCSKGGITVEAITHMQENNFGGIFKAAVDAAKKRSEELMEQ